MPNERTSCSGQCCERFPLTIASSGVETIEYLRSGEGAFSGEYEEGTFVADMLIPIQGPLRGEKILAGVPFPGGPPGVHGWPTFTCKHLGPTGCMVYAQRPNICRRHGVTTNCDYKNDDTCTIKTVPWLLSAETLTRPRKGDAQGKLVPRLEVSCGPLLKEESREHTTTA